VTARPQSRRSPRRTVALFAGIRVRDLTAARAWYERLLGEPAFFPNDSEVVWMLAEDRSVYILADPDRAGDGLVTLFVDDLDAAVAAIADRGLEPAERETYRNGVRKATYRDADGNEVGFGGAPAT
jgi:catechol 2,3-dioxygenase-like lactoylglutathione lyase family enzyme